MLFKYAPSNYREYTAEESHLKHLHNKLFFALGAEDYTAVPKEVSVMYKAHVIQNITGLPELQFLCLFWLTHGNISRSL